MLSVELQTFLRLRIEDNLLRQRSQMCFDNLHIFYQVGRSWDPVRPKQYILHAKKFFKLLQKYSTCQKY
jgi:uncharacterized UPF0160 family protein